MRGAQRARRIMSSCFGGPAGDSIVSCRGATVLVVAGIEFQWTPHRSRAKRNRVGTNHGPARLGEPAPSPNPHIKPHLRSINHIPKRAHHLLGISKLDLSSTLPLHTRTCMSTAAPHGQSLPCACVQAKQQGISTRRFCGVRVLFPHLQNAGRSRWTLAK